MLLPAQPMRRRIPRHVRRVLIAVDNINWRLVGFWLKWRVLKGRYRSHYLSVFLWLGGWDNDKSPGLVIGDRVYGWILKMEEALENLSAFSTLIFGCSLCLIWSSHWCERSEFPRSGWSSLNWHATCCFCYRRGSKRRRSGWDTAVQWLIAWLQDTSYEFRLKSHAIMMWYWKFCHMRYYIMIAVIYSDTYRCFIGVLSRLL